MVELGVLLLLALQNVMVMMLLYGMRPKREQEEKKRIDEDRELAEHQRKMAKEWGNLLSYDGSAQEEEAWRL